MQMLRHAALLTAVTVPLALAACAPTNFNTTFSNQDIGRPAEVSFGVIQSMRPVNVQGQPTGIGAVAGGVAGGAAGSLIGNNNVTANIIGAVAGALAGGLAGNAIEKGVSSGTAVEFIIRGDDGRTISVVQTNENNFRPGERVMLTYGATTRLSRPGV